MWPLTKTTSSPESSGHEYVEMASKKIHNMKARNHAVFQHNGTMAVLGRTLGLYGTHILLLLGLVAKESHGFLSLSRIRFRSLCTNRLLRVTPTASSWYSHLSENPDAALAVRELLEPILQAENSPDLAFLFVGQYHAANFNQIVRQSCALLPQKTRCVAALGGGVVGNHVEVDNSSLPGISILTAALDDAFDGSTFDIFYYNELAKPPPPPNDASWSWLDKGSCLLFGDPWAPMEPVLRGLQKQQTIVAGGITCPVAVQSGLAIDGQPLPQGSVLGLGFPRTSSLSLQVIVAQGCRPIGPVFKITASTGTLLEELNGQPALTTLEALAETVSAEDKHCMSRGPAGWSVLCGIATTESEPRDFLVRQLLGMQPQKKALVVAGDFGVGDEVQFHVRDGTAAWNDLDLMVQRMQTERLFVESSLSEAMATPTNPIPVAAVQVSCVARGRSLFGKENADVDHIYRLLGSNGAVAGFYANGEIGPVGIAGITEFDGSTFLHGFTLVAAIICDSGGVTLSSCKATLVDNKVDDSWG